MTIGYRGNLIILRYAAGEIPQPIQLKDGYSFDPITVLAADNISAINTEINFVLGSVMRFPPINSKSPCTFSPVKNDNKNSAYLRILIMKFGQIPDPHYFDGSFKSILVKGDDGEDYNVIPSDQFK